jgi:hypothetical protein
MKWTELEIGYLIKNYLTKTYKEIGLYLNRTESSIEKKIKSLGLSKNKTDDYTFWTDVKINYLIKNKDLYSCKDLADKLGFNEKKIIKKLSELKLKKKRFVKNVEIIPKIELNYGDIKCSICNRGFKDLKGLQIHLTKKHENINIEQYYLENIGKQTECFFCKKEGRFISIDSGYRNLCESEECIRKSFNSNSIEGIIYRTNSSNDEATKILLENNKKNLEKRLLTFEKNFENDPLWHKRRSHYTIEFWKNKGFSDEDSKVEVKRTLSDLHRMSKKHRNENPNLYKDIYTNQKNYWLKMGYNEDESISLVKKRQATFSKEMCIQKYGEENGSKRWLDRQEKWIFTLNSKSDEEKIEINRRKLSGRYCSKISQVLFWDIYNIVTSDQVMFSELNSEYYLISEEKKWYAYDYVDITNKKCIEFNGDFWHCNEETITNIDEIHRVRKISWLDILKSDNLKLELIKNRGYKIMIVWESEYKKNPKETLEKCIKFLNE